MFQDFFVLEKTSFCLTCHTRVCAHAVCAGSQMWQKCFNMYVKSCRNCRTRATDTTSLMPPTSLDSQKLRNSHCLCTQYFFPSETQHQDPCVFYIQYIYLYKCTYLFIVDVFFLALQRSSGGETTDHVELSTSASNTKDQRAFFRDSEVRLSLKLIIINNKLIMNMI